LYWQHCQMHFIITLYFNLQKMDITIYHLQQSPQTTQSKCNKVWTMKYIKITCKKYRVTLLHSNVLKMHGETFGTTYIHYKVIWWKKMTKWHISGDRQTGWLALINIHDVRHDKPNTRSDVNNVVCSIKGGRKKPDLFKHWQLSDG